MTRTFLDAGILIEAARGESRRALTIFNDPNLIFVSTRLLLLEILPKAHYYKRVEEVAFYEWFFKHGVSIWVDDFDILLAKSLELASQYGLNALDACHLAAALLAKCEDFLTTEKPGRPIYRVEGLNIRFWESNPL